MSRIVGGLRLVAHSNQFGNVHAHHETADAVVLFHGGVTELQHGTQNSPGAVRLTGRRVNGTAQLRQGAQCRRHRLGVSVVRVVNDDHAVGTVGASHTPLRSCRRLVERASNLLTRDTAVVGDCRSSQQVVHVVLTDQLRGNLVLATVEQAQSELGAAGVGGAQV